MDADSFQRQRDIDPIIDEELGPTRSGDGLHLTCKRHKFPDREITLTKLNGQ
jgi:hypothetical protein